MNRRTLILTRTIVTLAIVILVSNFQQAHGLKPEIQHKFREPEKRPLVVVSTFFVALVASPMLLMFALWSRLVSISLKGLNLRRIAFHILFLLVLVCYARFWFGVNMFDTMRVTAPLICCLFYVFK